MHTACFITGSNCDLHDDECTKKGHDFHYFPLLCVPCSGTWLKEQVTNEKRPEEYQYRPTFQMWISHAQNILTWIWWGKIGRYKGGFPESKSTLSYTGIKK